jgi:hypothetical protein
MERRMEKKEMGKDYSRANREKNGMDPRRYQEMRDAGMIQEDHSATANLPQEVKYHDWPENHSYENYGLDDTIRGVDKQEREDVNDMKRHLQPGKY